MVRKLLIILLGFYGLAMAQSVEECMECHSDKELVKSINDSTEISLFVDLNRFENSIHGGFECIDCHTSIQEIPHESDLPHVICANCHEDAQEVYKESVHGISNIKLGGPGATCSDCHGKHNILAASEDSSRINRLNIQRTCGNCHDKPEIIRLLGLGGEGPAILYHGSVHDQILHSDQGSKAPTCISCHGAHDIYVMSDPRSKFSKLNRPKTCGNCHQKAEKEYEKSIHWQAVKRGHFESPVCNDCHGEHHIVSPKEKDALTNRLNLSSQVCAKCHSSPTMMTRFGLDPQQFATYMRTYHGLALLKGSPDAANCTSCHEVHAILPQESPESSINKANLSKTCGKCHNKITADFIKISVHPKDLESRNPIAYYARNIYVWLILLTIGSMIVHNIIILRYYIIQKRLAIKTQRTVQRFMPFEVYQHALLIISFTILVITGFALKYPETYWVRWLVSLGMTETIRSNLHRIAALILIAISLIQVGYFIFYRKGRREVGTLIPKISDVTGFWANMKYYLRLSKERPKFGRWDYTEKAEYLALIWGTAVMAITGFVLWFPEFFISFLPSWLFEVSEVVHFFEAWLATLAILIWHWFFVIYHPEKYPMSLTWLDGKITEEEMKHHHPLEYEEESKQSIE